MSLYEYPSAPSTACFHGLPNEAECTACRDEVKQVEHLLMGEYAEAIAYALAVIAHYKLPDDDIGRMRNRVAALSMSFRSVSFDSIAIMRLSLK